MGDRPCCLSFTLPGIEEQNALNFKGKSGPELTGPVKATKLHNSIRHAHARTAGGSGYFHNNWVLRVHILDC
jgi:hypothetical protein